MDENSINIIIKDEMISWILSIMESYDISFEELKKEVEEEWND